VLYAYTDESYTSQFYYQSAFVIDSAIVSEIHDLLVEANIYAQGFGISAGTEYHGHSIMSATDGWESLEKNFRAKAAIYRDVLQRIAQTKGRLFIQGVDTIRLNTRYSYPDSPHTVTLRHLLENIDGHADGRSKSVRVICDHLDDSNSHLRDFDTYKQFSTRGYKPSALERISDMSFEDSKSSPGIQIADLCVYLYRRLDAHKESSPKTAKAVQELWQILRPIVVTTRLWIP